MADDDGGVVSGEGDGDLAELIDMAERARTVRSRVSRGRSMREVMREVSPPPDSPPDGLRRTPSGLDARPWEAACVWRKDGTLGADPGNVAVLLQHLPEWAGVLEWDALASRVRLRRRLPPCPELADLGQPAELTDAVVTYVQHWLALRAGVSWGREAVADGLLLAARACEVDPLLSYLDGLVWDGTGRLESWLAVYLGAQHTQYTALVGRLWAISAAARGIWPGCQADHVLVLEGRQGTGKSSAARVLGGDWYLPRLPHLRDYERAAHQLQGHWLVEIGELDAFRGAAETQIKDFLSLCVDKYRAPYERLPVSRKRRCVFLGTTNRHTYSHDETGARRIWGVRTGSVDLAALQRDRDQIWAEAVHLAKVGAQWWPSDRDTDVLTPEQEERWETDSWEALIEKYVIERSENRSYFTLAELEENCLELKANERGRPTSTRVGQVMVRLGFEVKRKRIQGVKHRVYSKN